MTSSCSQHPLRPAKLVAIATDKYLSPTTPFADPVHLPGLAAPKYGQDITFGTGRAAPAKQSVGKTEAELKAKMEKLLGIFASGDTGGMAKRLFDAFLAKKSSVTYFDDLLLNQAAAQHQNILDFCSMALSAPNSPRKSPGKTRIHQALKNANWDIRKIVVPTDLGVPAFNSGDKVFTTGDFDNGLGLMINGVQYAYVFAQNYHYDATSDKYCLGLKFVFYDVFGLDDDDLREYGAASDAFTESDAAQGITAWWQLQHQFGYAPLVTRIVVERTVEVPTK